MSCKQQSYYKQCRKLDNPAIYGGKRLPLFRHHLFFYCNKCCKLLITNKKTFCRRQTLKVGTSFALIWLRAFYLLNGIMLSTLAV